MLEVGFPTGDDKQHGSGRVDPGDASQRVGTEALRERDGDPEELREKLIDAIGAEFTTCYTYLRMHLAGNEDYEEITEDARFEDRAHFELVAPRVYELEGKLPNDIRYFADRASCPDAELPDNPRPVNILGVLLEVERCAIRTRSEVCGTTEGADPRTYVMVQRILQEVIEHEAWFVELLSMERDSEVNPAGHFVRGEPVDAPLSTNRRFNDSA